jgi:hypothetical protein
MDAKVEEETADQLMLRIMRNVNRQVFQLLGDKVNYGPFQGMIIPEYNAAWNDGNASTKLLGTYEHEIQPAIEHAMWRDPKILVNVGCAEGYYAIGLARLYPDLMVFACDLDLNNVKCCSEYAEKNDVSDQIEIFQGCVRPEEMNLVFPEWRHKLFIIDCEGYEITLVDPTKCPLLRESDLIIECHDFLNAGTSSTLADRLADTHLISRVLPSLPDFNKFSFVREAPNIMSVLALVEKRPMPFCWLLCWAKNKGQPGQ